MKFTTSLALFTAALGACAHAQEPDPAPAAKPPAAQQPDAAAVVAEVLAQFQKEGISYDGKAKTVTIAAVVNEPPDPIEYLLIHRRGKRHEAMFYTESKPSVLNAALLMLGLQPGKNATYEEKQPPPTLEEIEKGADPVIVHAPEGMQFWMTVSFKDPDGKQQDYCVEDLLLNLRTQKAVRGASWVFLGGRMAPLYKNEPPVFVADYEGNLVSVCYLAPANQLGTMSHPDARDDQIWWLSDKCPPPGTPVQFTFHKDKPELVRAREERLGKEPPDAPAGATQPGEGKEPGKEPGKGDGKKGG